MTTETTFGDLQVGDRFTWRGAEYVKVKTDKLPRYGWVNCRSTASYYDLAGDGGYRFLEDDQKVEIEELLAGEAGSRL
jgi:hypothetical protein